MARPEKCTDEMLSFLDDLRESGLVNMIASGPSLMNEYPELDKHDAKDIVLYWMGTFGERHKGGD